MQGVAADTAVLEVSVDSLQALPPEASFRARKGRAGVEVRRRLDGRIVVTANCDSLQRLCEMYTLETSLWKERYAELQNHENRGEVRETESAIRFGSGMVTLLFLLLMAAFTIMIYKFKRK